MDIKKILTPKQIEICVKEQYYYQKLGVKKSLLQIALAHNFVQKKERARAFNLDLIKRYEFIVTDESDEALHVERKELLGKKRLAELEAKLGKRVEQKSIPVREFQQKFDALLAVDPDDIEKKIKQFNAHDADDSEVLQIFEMLLRYAVRHNVSDMHINAYEALSWLRFRIDGKIQARYLLNPELASRIALILKEQSGIDMVNVTMPQSGGFARSYEEVPVDFRVEIAPSHYGENIVVRLLNKRENFKSLASLFPPSHPMHEPLHYSVNEKNGFFLIVGPTGSGKSTTLNAIVSQRDRLHEIIYMIEDPIEYKVDFVTQYQVNETIGFDFPAAMKSVMRQDPDVIVIGEMRDRSSIDAALKAAHSGHMVFSTLHTSNTYMAMERIRDEGGDLFILAYALSGIIAQRLVPRLCGCKQEAQSDAGERFFQCDGRGFEKKGCIKCDFTGYAGRVLLTDMVFIPPDMKARYQFYLALKESTVLKAWDNFTTMSYLESARYLFEKGECDLQTLKSELFSLGYADED